MAVGEINTVTLVLPDPGGDDVQFYAMRAPSDAQGGGARIVGGYAVNNATLAAGTTNYFGLQLLRYSNIGTPAVNGTIADTIGGSTTGWADGVPQSFTIDDDYSFIDAGEWVVVQYNEAGTGAPTQMTVTLQYEMGK
jgi:hypothetical protein